MTTKPLATIGSVVMTPTNIQGTVIRVIPCANPADWARDHDTAVVILHDVERTRVQWSVGQLLVQPWQLSRRDIVERLAADQAPEAIRLDVAVPAGRLPYTVIITRGGKTIGLGRSLNKDMAVTLAKYEAAGNLRSKGYLEQARAVEDL